MRSEIAADEMIADVLSIIHGIIMSDSLSPVHRAAMERALQLLIKANRISENA